MHNAQAEKNFGLNLLLRHNVTTKHDAAALTI